MMLVDRMFTGMLNTRLSEIALKPGAPFLGAGTGIGRLVRTTETTTLSAAVRENGVEAGLDALFTEAARVSKFGFTEPEFDRQKVNMLRGFERAMAEKDNQQSDDLAAEYIRNFTTDEPIPGIAYEYELYKRFIPAITLAELNKMAATWSPEPESHGARQRASETGPGASDRSKAGRPDDVGNGQDPHRVRGFGQSRALAQHEANARPRGRDDHERRDRDHGMDALERRPRRAEADDVPAGRGAGDGVQPGRHLARKRCGSHSCGNGGAGRRSRGLGTFDAVNLRKVLTGKVASAGASIGDYFEEINGSASPKDLETLFQTIYLRFTQPRADPTIFTVLTDQLKVALANQRNTPEFAFSEAFTSAMWQNNIRAKPMTLENVDEMSLDKSMAFYRNRFADASDFTFLFVGSFEPSAIRPLVETYLATLPSTGRKESWRDVGLRRATGIVQRRVMKGIEAKSQTRLVFSGPFEYDQQRRVTIRAMGMVLEGTLREALREDLGGTYGVSVSANYAKIPLPEYSISISFGSSPERADALVQVALDKIAALKANGPDDRDVNNIREIMLREYESSSRQNGFFLREISARYQHGEDLADLLALPDFYRKINGPAIQAAAREYFGANMVRVQQFPEGFGAQRVAGSSPDANRTSASPVSR